MTVLFVILGMLLLGLQILAVYFLGSWIDAIGHLLSELEDRVAFLEGRAK